MLNLSKTFYYPFVAQYINTLYNLEECMFSHSINLFFDITHSVPIYSFKQIIFSFNDCVVILGYYFPIETHKISCSNLDLVISLYNCHCVYFIGHHNQV